MIPTRRAVLLPRVRTLTQQVQEIFSHGLDGFWYDPLPPFLTQVSDGTIPVTAAEDPIGRWIDRSGNDNHGIQATAAARLTYSQRYNLLTYSEDVSNPAWDKGLNVVATDYRTLTNNDASTRRTICSIANAAAGATYTASFYATLVSGSGVGSLGMDFAGSTKTAITVTSTRTKFSYTRVCGTATNNYIEIYIPAGATWLVEEMQVNYGSTAITYQRITTATDYDTAGFLPYVKALGTDDSLTSATGGGGDAGFCYVAALKPIGGAGTLRTLWSDTGTNTGRKVQIDTNNKLSFSAGDGAAFTTLASTATLDVGTPYVITVRDNGTNLSVQIDTAAAETVARPVVAAGTAGFTVFKDNGAASSFAIADFYHIDGANNSALADAQVASLQAYARSRAGL